MGFKDKYTTDKTKESNKTEVSVEAFLNAEMLEALINKLEHMNLSK
jgi:mannitol-specific phosphotransferase system IIBC component